MKSRAPQATVGWVLIVLWLALAPQLWSAPLTIYVAPTGNDQWSGAKPDAAVGGAVGPLATLPAALQKARELRQAGKAADGVNIQLRGGTYALSEPLTIGPADSGTGRLQNLVISAYPGERPVLSGGRRITGWHRVEGKPELWEADVPAVREGKWYFRSLFVNGRRAQRARTPNEGFYRIDGDSPQDKPARLKFHNNDIKPAWVEPGDVEVVALLAWADFRMFIRSVNEAEHTAVLSTEPRPSNRESNARYYIENAPDGLDAPGEWYLNRRTGKLQYYPLPGEDMTKAEVIAPILKGMVRLQGDMAARKPVQFITLRGLTFADTDMDMPENGYADTQAAVAIRGEVFAEGVADCSIEDCIFTRLAGYAVELGKGCQRDRVVGNEMVDIGAGGIRIGEPAKREDPFEQNNTHLITDNHMHRLGRLYPPAVGVFILQSGTNWVAHNHIHDLYYTAISVGWNWGYQETPCRENVIEFNHLHDIGQGMLSDMGAVYTLGIQRGTIIRDNVIHDVNSFTYGGWGLYPDEGSTDIIWERNLVYRTKSAGFHQHYGRENVVRNNIFAFGREHQVMRTRNEDHTSFYFTNNIVYFDSGDLLGSNWQNDHFVIDHNVYFDKRFSDNTAAVKFDGGTLAQWQMRGHDANSIVADPLFVAPDKNDFRLRPESPALKRGIKTIDPSSVGVRWNRRD